MKKYYLMTVAKMDNIDCYTEEERAVSEGYLKMWSCKMTVVDSQSNEPDGLTFNAVWINCYPDIAVGDKVIVTTKVEHDSKSSNRVEVLEVSKLKKSQANVW